MDLLSDSPWPSDVQWAVDALTRRVKRRWALFLGWHGRRGLTVNVDPRDENAFEEVVAIAPYSIGGTGLSTHGKAIWDGNDTGTSFAARLTPDEEEAVRRAIQAGGGDPGLLVSLVR